MKNLNPKSKIIVIILLFTALLLESCSTSRNEPCTKTGFALDTIIKITLYDHADEALLNSCFSLCSDYEALFSKTVPTSDISRINHAKGKKVTVSPDTIALLKQADYYSKLSDGRFDITIASVNVLWDFTSDAVLCGQSTPPDDAQIRAALPHVDYRNIIISGREVMLKDPESSIDLGGIAKGYIADRLKDYLTSQGVTSGIIDLGGNILLIGSKPDGTSYHIGIKKPFDPNGAVMTSVDEENTSVVTSGIYERCFTYNGTLYHHILSPSTGYPADTDLNSVTIISSSSASCDALSTACMLLGLKDGMQLIESLPDTQAIFITKDNQIYRTAQ